MVRNKDGGIIFAPLVEAYRQLSDLLIREEFAIFNKDELVDKLAMTKKEIIENHEKTHVIEQGKGSDKRWRTYVPDPTRSKGLKLIVKTKREDLLDAIVDWYAKAVDPQADKPQTLEDLYPAWLDYITADTSLANAHSLAHDWNTFYKGDPLTKRKMASIKVPELHLWLLKKIEEHNLTRRKYNDKKTVLNSMYDYAVSMGYVDANVARQVPKIRANHFAVEKQKNNTERVYLQNETDSLINACLERFNRTHNTAYIGICLNLYLGLRVGELVALKVSDFKGSFVHIEREEVKNYETNDGKITRNGYRVVPHVKTPMGIRDIPLTSQASKYLSMIITENERKGFQSEYLFLERKTGQRMHNDSINNILRKYINPMIHTSQKANHGLRRTYISVLDASGMLTDEEIRAAAGHKHISTTRDNYLYSIKTDSDKVVAFEEALSGKSVIPV